MLNRIYPVLSPSLGGIKMRLNHLVNGSVFIRNYEPDKQAILKYFVQEGSTVFDIGANVGLHSFFCNKNIRNTTVHAFEPFADNQAYFKEVVRINQLQHIHLHPFAVGEKDGTAYFEQGHSNFTGKVSQQKAGVKIDIIQLDSWINKNGIIPDFLKIDVEGHESQVLKGAAELLRRQTAIFLIELHSPEQDAEVAQLLDDSGYEFYRVNPNAKGNTALLIKIVNKKATWPDTSGVWGNILALPKAKAGQLPETLFTNN